MHPHKRVVNRSQDHVSVCVLNFGHWVLGEIQKTLHTAMFPSPCGLDCHCCRAQGKPHMRESVPPLPFQHPCPYHYLTGGWHNPQRGDRCSEGLIDTSPDNILLCVARDNPWPGAYIKHIASTRVVKRYKGSPWCYAIFEICLRNEPSCEHWEQASLHKDEEAQLEMLKAEHPAKDKIRRCGMQLYAFVPSS